MEWVRQTDHNEIEIQVCVIIKTRRKGGRIEYQTVAKCEGDWAELVFVLYEDYGQFKDEVESGKSKHGTLDAIADRLSRMDKPYEFTLPDKTDDWYYAYCKPVIFRIDHEGKLG